MVSVIRAFYAAAGKVIFLLALPILRPLIKRTTRAYVLIVSGNEILVVRNWLGAQNWQLPGGGIKRNETPKQAAVREVREEIGVNLDPGSLKIYSKGRWGTDKLCYRYLIFIANYSTKPGLYRNKLEILNADWLSLEHPDEKTIPSELVNVFKSLKKHRRK